MLFQNLTSAGTLMLDCEKSKQPELLGASETQRDFRLNSVNKYLLVQEFLAFLHFEQFDFAAALGIGTIASD